jgi:DMSO/TMAO reductase YedYZ molybdopterin-dependent catalytic subunit
MTPLHEHDPLRPHSHEPNAVPPSDDPTFELILPNGRSHLVTVPDLQILPVTTVADCYIVSTGHGTSGPFAFTGVAMAALIQHYWSGEWDSAEIVSADGFGNRVMAQELLSEARKRPILLAYAADDTPLTRQQGVVRLIVPSETDDALRQVKWVGSIRLMSA